MSIFYNSLTNIYFIIHRSNISEIEKRIYTSIVNQTFSSDELCCIFYHRMFEISGTKAAIVLRDVERRHNLFAEVDEIILVNPQHKSVSKDY